MTRSRELFAPEARLRPEVSELDDVTTAELEERATVIRETLDDLVRAGVLPRREL